MPTEKLQTQTSLETKGITIPWAAFYDSLVWLFSFGKVTSMRNSMLKYAPLKLGDRVLDVGCGTGDIAIAAKSIVGPKGEIFGTDASAKMIQVAQNKIQRSPVAVSFQIDLIEKISFQENHFDVVMNSLVMHHLPDDLKNKGLAEMYRVLKPGGSLYIVDMQSTGAGSIFRRFSDLMIQLHGGHKSMQNNVDKLTPFIESTGFTNLEKGVVNRQLAFIRATK